MSVLTLKNLGEAWASSDPKKPAQSSHKTSALDGAIRKVIPMETIQNDDLFFDGLDSLKPRPKKIHNRSIYLTAAAIEAAKQHPGVPVRLAGGKFVDKAYKATLKAQATELDGPFKIDWKWRKDEETTSAKTGKVTTVQLGWAFLIYTGDEVPAEHKAPAVVVSIESAESKAEKKARKKAKKSAHAQRSEQEAA